MQERGQRSKGISEQQNIEHSESWKNKDEDGDGPGKRRASVHAEYVYMHMQLNESFIFEIVTYLFCGSKVT